MFEKNEKKERARDNNITPSSGFGGKVTFVIKDKGSLK